MSNFRCTIHNKTFDTVCSKCHPKVIKQASKIEKLRKNQKMLESKIRILEGKVQELIADCNNSDGTYVTSKGLGISYKTIAFAYGEIKK